jgi:hypothetical protein
MPDVAVKERRKKRKEEKKFERTLFSAVLIIRSDPNGRDHPVVER